MSLWKYSWDILRIGYCSLFKDYSEKKSLTFANILTYSILPIFAILGSLLEKFKIDQQLVSDILTILSIFLAITLGVIFIIPDKLSKRLESNQSKNESDKYSKIRYKNFCKLFVQRLTFVLILCVFLIIITILMKVLKTGELYFSSIILGLFTLAILSILKLVIDIYIFLKDDISEMKV